MAVTKKQELVYKAIVERVAAFRRPVPLGELYRSVQDRAGPLTIGQFHDALRDLAALGAIRLEPWTGAMYQLIDPECCFIFGREIVGYADRSCGVCATVVH